MSLTAVLQGRSWLLSSPSVQVGRVGDLLVVNDHLLHPYIEGNKLRKLDAVVPHWTSTSVAHVVLALPTHQTQQQPGYTIHQVTCGGIQSAHTAAVAAVAAAHGITAHLLLRGQPPPIPTGYHLLARWFGHVHYVSRADYVDRAAVLRRHQQQLLQEHASLKPHQVAVLPEGGATPRALLGLLRAMDALAHHDAVCVHRPLHIVVDCGTGTSAVGLALGCRLLGLPWTVTGVVLAEEESAYARRGDALLEEASVALAADFAAVGGIPLSCRDLPLSWVPREQPRRFGKVLASDIAACKDIGRRWGVLLDPIYGLAGWEVAMTAAAGGGAVVYWHQGGGLGLFGVAQRMPAAF